MKDMNSYDLENQRDDMRMAWLIVAMLVLLATFTIVECRKYQAKQDELTKLIAQQKNKK